MNEIKSFSYTIESFKFNLNLKGKIPQKIPSLYMFPVVYIIYCEDRSVAYIGETTNIVKRVQDHIKHSDKKNLKDIKIITSPYFNKSSVLHIENNLIQFMGSDGKFKLINKVEGLSNHNYYQKTLYQEVFSKVWADLKLKKLVNNDILEIQNSDLFKYSPFKALSGNQENALKQYFNSILDNTGDTTFFEGGAGTGKTILAVYLIKLLLTDVNEDDLSEYDQFNELIYLSKRLKDKLKLKKDFKVALVIPMSSLRETLRKVFKSIYGLSANMVISPYDVNKKDYDLLIVDEAHRLCQRKNIVNYKAFDSINEELGFDKMDGNQLDWIMKSSKRQVFFYDSKQSIKPSDISKEKFDAIKTSSKTINLSSQMRVQGGDDYIEFVDRLLTNDKKLVPWKEGSYDFKLFSSLRDMVNALEEKEKLHGLCRIISGYSWKWVSKNSDEADVTIDGVDLYWNRQSKDWINSTNKLNEMGCIHTTQGYDLNYAGIIFGSEITYNKDTGKIEIINSNYHDINGKKSALETELHDYIINIYKTIMYRGINGTFVYCYDKNLEEYFKKVIPFIS